MDRGLTLLIIMGLICIVLLSHRLYCCGKEKKEYKEKIRRFNAFWFKSAKKGYVAEFRDGNNVFIGRIEFVTPDCVTMTVKTMSGPCLVRRRPSEIYPALNYYDTETGELIPGRLLPMHQYPPTII